MDRIQELTKYLNKEKLGVEIGPWFSPIASKRNGYRCLVLDILDAQSLRDKAKVDPFIPKDSIANIEEVDLIGSSIEIADIIEKHGLLGQVDYIISSHNFEHLPNPIRFLQGCDKVLRPGGMLAMAVPDLRTCFDYFRPHTTLSAWLEAYFTSREKPNLTQIFEMNALHGYYHRNNDILPTFFLTDDPSYFVPKNTLQENYDWWKNQLINPDNAYHDVHCSTFTPASFELLICDLSFLKLIKMQVIGISETNGCEFYVYLQRPEDELKQVTIDAEVHCERRRKLLHRVKSEISINSQATFRVHSELKNANTKLGEQQKEIEELLYNSYQRIRQLEGLLNAVKESTSWRITSPLRTVMSWLRYHLRLVGG